MAVGPAEAVVAGVAPEADLAAVRVEALGPADWAVVVAAGAACLAAVEAPATNTASTSAHRP